MKKIIVLILAVLMCLPMFAGCSQPPELSEIKDELIAVLEKSYDVNEMIFGDGLKTEYDLSGVIEEYTDEMRNYETYYSDEQMYYQFYSPVAEYYMKDTDGDGLGDTKVTQPRNVSEIKALVSSVYSSSFSNKTYIQLFQNNSVTVNGTMETIKARYRDGFVTDDGESGSEVSDGVLRKYKFLKENKMNYISARGGRTVYDYDTMKIVKPSDADTVVIEIKGLYQDYASDVKDGNYDDWESVPDGYSWHTVRLTFVKENGAWKLDGASY